MEDRIHRDATPTQAGILWVSTYNLLGLNYPPDLVSDVMQGVRGMEDSSTYQATIAKGRIAGIEMGRVDEARNLLLRLGLRRLGLVPLRIAEMIDQTRDAGVLEALFERVLEIESWDELLP